MTSVRGMQEINYTQPGDSLGIIIGIGYTDSSIHSLASEPELQFVAQVLVQTQQ